MLGYNQQPRTSATRIPFSTDTGRNPRKTGCPIKSPHTTCKGVPGTYSCHPASPRGPKIETSKLSAGNILLPSNIHLKERLCSAYSVRLARIMCSMPAFHQYGKISPSIFLMNFLTRCLKLQLFCHLRSCLKMRLSTKTVYQLWTSMKLN